MTRGEALTTAEERGTAGRLLGSAAGADQPIGAAIEPTAKARLRWWRDALRRRLLALADLTAAALASGVVSGSVSRLGWGLAAVPAWILSAKLLGLYDRDHREIRHLTIDELPAIIAWSAIGVAIVALVLGIAGAQPPDGGDEALGFGVALAAAFTLRGAARAIWRRLTPPELTAILGEGQLAAASRRKLELFRDMHLSEVETDPDELDAGQLERVVQRVDRIVLASPAIDVDLIERLAVLCREREVKLSVVSPLRGRAGPALRLTQLADLPVFEYDTWDVSRSTMLLKRAMDAIVASLALVVTAPLFPLIAVALRLDSRGPILFAQRRAGIHGRPFRMYKFRTMAWDAEHRLEEVVRLEELEEPMFKVKGDPRTTRVGRILRRLSLDELPQLVNVLKGDMSLVGPRPEQLEVVDRYAPEHRFRLAVKPGMTGPMQVFGRGDLSFEERLAVEHDYIENLSLGRDLRILALTAPTVLRGDGAY